MTRYFYAAIAGILLLCAGMVHAASDYPDSPHTVHALSNEDRAALSEVLSRVTTGVSDMLQGNEVVLSFRELYRFNKYPFREPGNLLRAFRNYIENPRRKDKESLLKYVNQAQELAYAYGITLESYPLLSSLQLEAKSAPRKRTRRKREKTSRKKPQPRALSPKRRTYHSTLVDILNNLLHVLHEEDSQFVFICRPDTTDPAAPLHKEVLDLYQEYTHHKDKESLTQIFLLTLYILALPAPPPGLAGCIHYSLTDFAHESISEHLRNNIQSLIHDISPLLMIPEYISGHFKVTEYPDPFYEIIYTVLVNGTTDIAQKTVLLNKTKKLLGEEKVKAQEFIEFAYSASRSFHGYLKYIEGLTCETEGARAMRAILRELIANQVIQVFSAKSSGSAYSAGGAVASAGAPSSDDRRNTRPRKRARTHK